MDKPVLYVCDTPYHVLVSVAKLLTKPHPAQFCLTQALPGREGLKERLLACGLCSSVMMPMTRDWPKPVLTGWRKPFVHTLQKRAIKKAGFSLDPADYAEICLYNDWSPMGNYLQDLGASYTLGEDTFDNLRRSHEFIEEQSQQPGYQKRRQKGQGYLYWGAYRGASVIEVASKKSALYWPERQREFDLFAAMKQFTPEQMAVVRRVFIQQELPPVKSPTCLFLPRSYYIDGFLPSQHAQDVLCRDLVSKYADGYQLYIKTHPRDTTDYTALFPDAVVLDRFMPSELLDYCFDVRFDRAVGLGTHSIRNLRCADEIINLPMEDLEPYKTLV